MYIMGMVVCWHIVEAGGRKVTKTKKKPKASDFFKDEGNTAAASAPAAASASAPAAASAPA